jgi:hypothetical protein
MRAELEVADRLEEIKDEMLELLHEARRLVRTTAERSRAESYWLPHIEMALHDDHEYLGGSMCTMTDTIAGLRDQNPDEEEATR